MLPRSFQSNPFRSRKKSEFNPRGIKSCTGNCMLIHSDCNANYRIAFFYTHYRYDHLGGVSIHTFVPSDGFLLWPINSAFRRTPLSRTEYMNKHTTPPSIIGLVMSPQKIEGVQFGGGAKFGETDVYTLRQKTSLRICFVFKNT